MLKRVGFLVALCLATFPPLDARAETPSAPRSGDTLYRLDWNNPALAADKLPSGITVVNEGPDNAPCLRVTVTEKDGTRMVNIPIDLTPWQGMNVLLAATMRAENVTKPAVSYLGVKMQFAYESPTKGKQWPGLGSTYGSFPWQETTALANIEPDATKGVLQLGLQGSSGTVWISNVRVLLWKKRPVRPAPDPKAPAPFRGDNVPPRLRGVMSPNSFRVEDFDTLAKWNVNLIRWQITRNWGKADTDTDLADYNHWIDFKLDELSKALDAAATRGIKVVIDIHWPPGGRLKNSTLRMVLEKPYSDHFVALWEKIARRFKGHPAVWGYDLINEPVQEQPSPEGIDDWYHLEVRAAKAIRAIDPDTPIIFEVDHSDSANAYNFIEPIPVSRVIYQVHMYEPGIFTHQGVHTTLDANGQPSVTYPGTIDGKKYDRETLRQILAPVRAFQLAYNVPIYVGEFSAIRWAPGAAQYLDDCISIFEEYGWDWSYHAFREWGGWSVEAADLPYSPGNHPAAKEPTDRYLVLKKYFDLNKPAPVAAPKP
jgi:endoglucanase